MAGTTDGRRLYLAGGQRSERSPVSHGVQAQYDPEAGPVTSAAAWRFFDTRRLSPRASGIEGVVAAGRYVYYVPAYGCAAEGCSSAAFQGFVARYDSAVPFSDPRAWRGFDLTTVDPRLVGFSGAAFDGRHVYFVPSCDNSARYDCPSHGRLVRYDTREPFDAAGAYEARDLTALHPRAHGYQGAAFDGRYLYLGPAFNISGAPPTYATGTVVVRYDTTRAFGEAAAYEFFDVVRGHPGAGGYGAVAFDGRYVYFAPNGRLVEPHAPRQAKSGLVTRYDTREPFTETRAWAFFDVSALDAAAVGFLGAASAGRHLYLATRGTRAMQTALIVRLDGSAPLGRPSSWRVWDWTGIPAVRGPRGLVALGGYLYTVPNYPGTGEYSGVVMQVRLPE
jgi:hypothetical protein